MNGSIDGLSDAYETIVSQSRIAETAEINRLKRRRSSEVGEDLRDHFLSGKNVNHTHRNFDAGC